MKAGESVSVEGSVVFLTRYRVSIACPTTTGGGGHEGETESSQIHRLQRPEGGAPRVNVDGAFCLETGDAGLGVVVRDDAGQPLLMASRRIFHCRDAEEAEALACLEGVRMSSRWLDRDVVLESDCSSVIKMLVEKGPNRSLVAPIILDMERESSCLKSVEFVKVGREQNKMAHELAQVAR
ncbi:hypothetical protein HU200_050619 [Digitaria exilis]|uniref:RNase H type-1 domain-containing protein n=1 Tax=Digitaria exilis TaxID=1010633 RepID=A0A835ATE7_9POAL|nr:hypothetical protein HU200_050619 [Digitaria exilis]